MSNNPNPVEPRSEWLRWQISDELAESIAPGLREGSSGAVRVLVEWLTEDRDRLVSHCCGAMRVHTRLAGIPHFHQEGDRSRTRLGCVVPRSAIVVG